MAVFTAIATAITGAILSTATAATLVFGTSLTVGALVTSVIAGGLALATAKLTGAFDVPGQNLGPDPGSKIQLAPSTDNKIGIAYGKNFLSGPITDVAISNANKTMHYCITLSEYVEGGTYTVDKIYRNQDRLNFTGANVSSISEQNGGTSTDLANDIIIRVYAGSTNSTDQIFPTSGAVNATTMMPHWPNTTDYSMEGLVFAMVEVNYDAENGLVGLPPLMFELNNSISNPGDVLIDYMNNTRYGAGLSNSVIDVTSITGAANTSLKGYAAEQITYTNNGGSSATQDRWQINGYISTFKDASTNIQKICQASATFFTFDTKQGKFKAIPNQPSASTFSLNDDNIVSKISVSSTELYSLFNNAEVEFGDKNRRDQTNSVVIDTPGADRNPNEPDNSITMRMDLINDNIRAQTLGNLDLSQSRKGTVVTCQTDFSGMQIDTGDVVDLTNADFGWTAKEFRVLRHEEQINEGGMITCGLTLLEYDDSVYLEATIVETDEEGGNVDIPVIPPIITPPPILFRNIMTNIIDWSSTGSGVNSVFTVIKANNIYTFVFPSTPGTGHVVGNIITVDGGFLGGVPVTNDLTFRVASVDGSGGVLTCDTLTGTAVTYDEAIWGNFNVGETMGNVAVGSQIEDKPAPNVAVSNANVITNIIPIRELDFLNEGFGIPAGDYSFMSAMTPVGQIPGSGTANFTSAANVNIEYANGYIDNHDFGINADFIANIPSVLEANKKITIEPGAVGGNVVLRGRNTLAPTASGVGFTNMRYDMVRFNKGDIF
jgi:hypothetical protein